MQVAIRRQQSWRLLPQHLIYHKIIPGRYTCDSTCCGIIFFRICGAYISWEMTPTSIGGEKQAGISGGSQSPSWYSLRQGAHCPVDNGFAPTETECRLAEVRSRSMSCNCMTRTSQQKCQSMRKWSWIMEVEHVTHEFKPIYNKESKVFKGRFESIEF